MALSPRGALYVTNSSANSVTVYAPGDADGERVCGRRQRQHPAAQHAAPLRYARRVGAGLLRRHDRRGGQAIYTYPAGARDPRRFSVESIQLRAGPFAGLAPVDALSVLLSSPSSGSVDLTAFLGGVTAVTSGPVTGLRSPSGVLVTEPLAFGPLRTSQPTITLGTPYSEHTLAFGGLAPYTWSAASGTLPPGLTLDRMTGAVSGTATAAGTSTVVLKVTDSASPAASIRLTRTYTVPPAIQPELYVANGANSLIYAFALSSSGDASPITAFGPPRASTAGSARLPLRRDLRPPHARRAVAVHRTTAGLGASPADPDPTPDDRHPAAVRAQRQGRSSDAGRACGKDRSGSEREALRP